MTPKEHIVQMIKEANTALVINFPDSTAKRRAEDCLSDAIAYVNDLGNDVERR